MCNPRKAGWVGLAGRGHLRPSQKKGGHGVRADLPECEDGVDMQHFFPKFRYALNRAAHL